MSTTETTAASNSSMEVETSDVSIDDAKDTSDNNIPGQETKPEIQEKMGEELDTVCAEDGDTNRDTPTPDFILPQDTSVDASVERQSASKSPEHEQTISEMESSQSKIDILQMAPPEIKVNTTESDEPKQVEIKDSQNDEKQESQKKRKAEEEDSEHKEKLKKSRQSCVIVYEGKPRTVMATPVLDLTVEATPPELPLQEITLHDESQEFSLRYDKDMSPIPQGDRVKVPEENKTPSSPSHDSDKNKLLLAEITTLKAKLDYYKTENAELQSQIEKLKEKSECFEADLEATFPSSKEGVHTYTEKCPLYGTVLFTVDDKTNQIVRAQVKQLSLLDECLPVPDDKHRTSLSSGVLADKSFQSNGSSVSVPGPFPLPQLSRKSVMSAVSSTTSSSELSSVSTAFKKQGLRSYDGPFAVPHPPTSRLVNIHCRVETMSCGLGCSKTYPHVDLSSPSPDVLTPSSETTTPSPDMNVPSPKSGKGTTRKKSNTALKNGTQESNGEVEDIIKNGESAENEKQKLLGDTPQRQSAIKSRRKRQATTSTPVSAKRTAALKTTPRQKQTVQAQKSTAKETAVSIKPGGRPVFGRWTDGKYYPGWVYSDSGSMLKVYFCDGNVKDVTSLKVIPANWVVVGSTALACNAEETYEPYIIVGIEEGDEEGPKYILEQDKKSCIVPFPRLALTEDQVQDIKQPPTDPSGGFLPTQKLHMVSLDNVLDRPRTRTPTVPTAATPKRKKKNSSSVEPSTSHTSITTQDTLLVNTTDTEYSTEADTNDETRGFEMHPLDRESSPLTLAAHLKGKASVGHPAKSRKGSQEDASVVEELGPIPEPGSIIFSGNSFLITYAESKRYRKAWGARKVIRENHTSESDTTDYTSETTDFENSSPPFNKERLRTQIRRGGGKLYSSLEQVPADELDKTFLITDSPSCTPLYIQCLVKGIPAYSHDIIINCCSENTSFSKMRQNTVMLPAGWSLERQMWMERSKRIKIFKDLLILLAVNQNEGSIRFWKKILIDVGARVQLYKDKISANSLKVVSIIVSDNECPPDLLEKVANLDIPVVSLTWVQQCIIDSDKRPYEKHPAYLYSYISEPESPEY